MSEFGDVSSISAKAHGGFTPTVGVPHEWTAVYEMDDGVREPWPVAMFANRADALEWAMREYPVATDYELTPGWWEKVNTP